MKLILEMLKERLPDAPHSMVEEGCRRAAVLVPLFLRGDRIGAVFIKRPTTMRNHSGQFAFPGGASEENDKSPEETALREACEEIGLGPSDVTILGRLDDIRTGTGFIVTPIVGGIPHPYGYCLEVGEVEFLIEPILSELRPIPGIYGMEYYSGNNRIWGATARILCQLLMIVDSLGARC